MTDLTASVRHRARFVCEYCLDPEAASRIPFHIEHVIATRRANGERQARSCLPALQLEQGHKSQRD
jgi:hypothetical protein